MQQKVNGIKRIVIIAIVIQLIALLFLWLGLKKDVLVPLIMLVIEGAIAFYIIETYGNALEDQSIGVKKILGSTAEEAYLTGGVGLVMYDDDYVITWMSDLFAQRNINRIGHRILTWLPEADDLIAGRADTTIVPLDDKIYEISRKSDAPVIIFRDITDEKYYQGKYEQEQLVLGLASFDNYEESTQYADEADVSSINTAVRTPVNEYCLKHGIVGRRLNHSRYLLVLNERIFQELVEDRFSVLNTVRKAAQNMDVSITLSMAFARGSSDILELDEMASNLMDLATTRGGDQVAVQSVGEEVKYFGGSREATEKRSRVRVRVISHAMRDLVMNASNVIICGHKNADFDCIGSAICLSQMVKALHKPVSIIAKTGGIEEKIAAVLKEKEAELEEEVNFITESEALNQLQDNTLVIVTDHHNITQSNGAKVLAEANKIMVIDHHRRSTDMGFKPVLVYIEAGASSTCELVTEMMPYVARKTDLSEIDATIMLTGMIIDTQNWRVRTGARTYEAASALRKIGADPQAANNYLKDTFEEFALKNRVLSTSERYDHGIVIAPVEDKELTRSLLSQMADSLLSIQGVNAAFVIANSEDQTCISARSNGKINVQVLMESMGGGGHLTSAATQRDKMDISALKQELIVAINKYFEEEQPDESDS